MSTTTQPPKRPNAGPSPEARAAESGIPGYQHGDPTRESQNEGGFLEGGSDDPLTGHCYDGIQEYDNPMPRWWLWIFYVTIVWSGIYVFGTLVGFVDDYQADLHAELETAAALTAELAADQPEVDEALLAAAAGDSLRVDAGAMVFAASCASCHGPEGQGLIGPNLTDSAWIHGPELMEMYEVVAEGVPAKGMPAWGAILTHQDLIDVVAFLEGIKGTSPANPKAPEGTDYPAP